MAISWYADLSNRAIAGQRHKKSGAVNATSVLSGAGVHYWNVPPDATGHAIPVSNFSRHKMNWIINEDVI